MKARVIVTLKSGVLDPQGKAIEGALKSLGVAGVRQRAPRQGFRHRDRRRQTARRRTASSPRRAKSCSPTRSSKITLSTMNSPPRAAVILFPGSNREGDVARALRQASGAPPAIVWHDDRALPRGNRPRRPARRFFLWRLSALRRDRGARAHHGRRARSRRARRSRPRHLQRLPNSVRGGSAARRSHAQRRAAASFAGCSIFGSRTTRPRSPAATRAGRWSSSPSRTAKETTPSIPRGWRSWSARAASPSAIATPPASSAAAPIRTAR